MERLIFHVDVNSAFLSWEAVRRVGRGEHDIRHIPSAVGGDKDKRTSVILAKSVSAQKYGITTGEPVAMALKKCPGLVIVPPDFSLYVKCSKAFKDICRQYAPVVEEYSIDECFMDMTGTNYLYPDPIKTAYEIKERIKGELGFTVNIGIGNNKLLAKMAGDFEKPDKVHTLFCEEIPEKMWPLPVRSLLFVGKATAAKLEAYNIKTIGELAATELKYLQSMIGEKAGIMMHDYANGIDDTPVTAEQEEAKGYSVSTTLEENVEEYERAYQILRSLADTVAARLRLDGCRAGCVCVTIRGNDMKKHSHQQHLKETTDITKEIYEISQKLFDNLWDGHMPLRLLGISLTDIDREGYVQMSLFDNGDREREKKLDKTMDELRTRYGFDSVVRGSELSSTHKVGKKHRAKFE